jgi:TRAP-type mannitol/chloroaromatic compound transport system permease small subunit
MSGLLAVSRVIDWLNERFGWICDYMLAAACLISAGNAFMRYAFSYSSNAYLEIQWYLFGAAVMLGASYTLKRNEHVRVDVIYGQLSDRGRLWVDLFGFIIFLLPVTLIMLYLCVPFFQRSFASGEVSMNAGGLTLWPIKLMLPLGFFLLLLQTISEIIKRISALSGLIELETKYTKPLQ